MASKVGQAWKLEQMALEYRRRGLEKSSAFGPYYRGIVEGLRLAAEVIREGVAAKRNARQNRQRVA